MTTIATTMTTSSKANVYNQFQRFCSKSNVPKEEVKKLYKLHRNKIKFSNPTLWAELIQNKSIQESVRQEKKNGEGEEEENVEGWEGEGVGEEGGEKTASGSGFDYSPDMIRDIYHTLNDIKAFLHFLSSEPSRHVKSYISFEEKTDQNILNKWGAAMNQIMQTLRKTEQFNCNTNKVEGNGGEGLIIDLKQIYVLINDHLLNIPQVDKNDDVNFVPVTYESDTRIKLLFETKRKTFVNEHIYPAIMKNEHSLKNGIYFFYNPRELLSLIEQRYRNEMVFHSEYITTSQSKLVEHDFYHTQFVYITLHAMLHLLCSILYKNSFLSHDDTLYYKTVENIVPKPLFRYFLMPNIG